MDKAKIEGTKRLPDRPACERPRVSSESPKKTEHLPHDDAADLINAKKDAEAIIRQAKEETKRHREQALKTGHEEGYQAGISKALDLLDSIQQWHEEMKQREATRWWQIERDLSRVVVDVVERILCEELEMQPEHIATRVRHSLGSFSETSDVTLSVSPSDLDRLLSVRGELEQELPPRVRLLFNTDTELGPGEFRLQGDEGIIVGTIDDAVESLRNALGEREEER